MSHERQGDNFGMNTVFEEIEYLLAQDKVLDAIERLRTVAEHRHQAINFSRRWHAIRDKQQRQLLTDEQVETEVNRIVDAMLEICGGAQSAVSSKQFSEDGKPLAGGGSQSATPSVHQSERDYFENVGGNVYTGPVTIHQHGRESAAAKPPSETTETVSGPKNALSRALRKELLDFLTPLPVMQSANSRRAALYAAGLDSIIDRVDLNGAAYEVVSAIMYALEQHGMEEDTPALILLLRYVATTVGSDKQATIQRWCEHIFKVPVTPSL